MGQKNRSKSIYFHSTKVFVKMFALYQIGGWMGQENDRDRQTQQQRAWIELQLPLVSFGNRLAEMTMLVFSFLFSSFILSS